MVRFLFRITIRLILGFLAFVLSFGLCGLIFPYIPSGTTYAHMNAPFCIYIQSNGIHTDFVMPLKSKVFNWSRHLPVTDVEQADSTYAYVAIGWGDKGFFIATPTWNDLKASTVFKAAFGLSSSAMHVTYKRNEPQVSETCKAVYLTEQQYQLLIKYVVASFQIKEGKFVRIAHPGYGAHDCFYEANGSYSMFKTCNVWTGKGLAFIGVKAGCWTPFAAGVLQNLSK